MNHDYSTPPPSDLIGSFRAVFERQKHFAQHAFDQLDDDRFFRAPAPGLNPCAVIANHLSGNMISRFTDFLTTDGEKPDRNREHEFDPPPEPTPQQRARIMRRWEHGWSVLLSTLDSLTLDDLNRTVTIRSVPHTVHAALTRQLDHYAFHVGQINTTARILAGTDNWTWFTLAPGQTPSFNARLSGRQQSDQP